MLTKYSLAARSALLAAGLCAVCNATPALADPGGGPIHAIGHAPIGVMGDHTHNAGEAMFSYRLMHMEMDGNRNHGDTISPEDIVTSVANIAGAPVNLRVVPTTMAMDMHMFGGMWAPTNRVTLMAMGSYIAKEMEHVTFAGMSGTTRLGSFTAKSEGFGDTRVSALIRLVQGSSQTVHATLGVSLPTGAVSESDAVLTPMNMRPTLVLPYAMQLGSGTFDPYAAVTVNVTSDQWRWGAQEIGRASCRERV